MLADVSRQRGYRCHGYMAIFITFIIYCAVLRPEMIKNFERKLQLIQSNIVAEIQTLYCLLCTMHMVSRLQ